MGDVRLSRRVGAVAQGLMDQPGVSLPKAMGTEAGLEGAYRLVNHEEVSPGRLLRPHVEATAGRVAAARMAYAISDTTEVRYGGDEREGLGPLQGGGRGFLAHVCLAVAADGSRLPLGVLSLETVVRAETRKNHTRASRRSPERESLRWRRGVEAAQAAIDGRAELIHLMDAEADIYGLLARLKERSRFIVRVAQNRAGVEETETGRLFAGLAEATVQVTREIQLSARVAATKGHPRRKARLARLSIAARTLTISRPAPAPTDSPRTLTLNFVRVFEQSPPADEPAMEWKLVTSERIDSAEALERIVDGYRTRWVIEELFKALKSGCGLERSQLESLDALLNFLALKLPVAVQLLALRSLANDQRQALAVLTRTQLEALHLMSSKPLGRNPSVAEAFTAIARLGGHIRNNGPPGWIVIGRGFDDLLKYEAVLLALKNPKKRDQS